jgi:hypothetical protein
MGGACVWTLCTFAQTDRPGRPGPFVSIIIATTRAVTHVHRPCPLPPHPTVPSQDPELDYRSLFLHGGVAQGVARLDGHFVDCNRMFSELTG